MMREIIVARWAYALLLVIAAINLVWLTTTRVDLILDDMFGVLLPSLMIGSLLVLTGRMIHLRTHAPRALVLTDALFQGLLFLSLAWLNMRVLNHLSMSTALPYADHLILAWDRALGFDWLAYFEWVHDRPDVIRLLDMSYTSLTPLSALALIGLVVMGQTLRARFFVESFFVTALVCISVGWLLPAEAAVEFTIADMAQYPNFAAAPGTYHLVHMDALRAPEGRILLDPLNLPGLVTIPSFHTAAGVVLAVAFWRTPMALPVLAYTVVMIASTPIFGSHYFVDLIAGTAVALAVMAIIRNQPRYAALGPQRPEGTGIGVLRGWRFPVGSR